MIAREYSRTLTLHAAALVISVAGCSLDQPVAKKSKSDSAVRVKTVSTIERELAKRTRQPATVHPFFETGIHCKVSGFVAEVVADIGDDVQAGDTLARIDIPEMRKQKQTIESRIELLLAEEQAAFAGVELAEASILAAQSNVEQAKAELGRIEASLAAAEAEFQRTEDLVERGSLENRVLDEARKKRDSETAALKAAQSAIAAAEADVNIAKAEKTLAAARLRTAKAQTQITRNELAELEVSIDYSIVKAPFAGMVTERHVNLGDLIGDEVGGDTKPLFVLSQIDKVRVQIPVPESDAPFVQPGDAITLSFPSFSSEPAIETTVTRISGSLDPSTRTMKVEAEMKNPDRKLLPGMFGEAVIDLDTKVAATMLPSRAVRFDASGNAFVYALDKDNQVRIAEITTGLDTGTEIEILQGITAGQTVIDSHLKRFTDGEVVQPL